MTGVSAFDALIRSLGEVLQERGFRRKGRHFSSRRNGAWAVVGFQKSQRSSSSTVIFTINFGIALESVLRFDRAETELPPSIERCHWSTRVGFLLPMNEDIWWTIDGEQDVARVRKEVEPILREVALPKIDSLASDAALCQYWLRGGSDGLTEIQRLRTLSIVLKNQGETAALDATIGALQELSEGRPTQGLVAGHIQRLGVPESR